MPRRYSCTNNTTISWWHHADLQLSRRTIKDPRYLESFCVDKGLSVNPDKINVMVFNSIQAWVMRSEHDFFLREEKVHPRSYTYLEVTFTQGLSSPYRRQHALKFLMDMQPLMLFIDNVHIYHYMLHELNCGYLIHLSCWLFSMDWNLGTNSSQGK